MMDDRTTNSWQDPQASGDRAVMVAPAGRSHALVLPHVSRRLRRGSPDLVDGYSRISRRFDTKELAVQWANLEREAWQKDADETV